MEAQSAIGTGKYEEFHDRDITEVKVTNRKKTFKLLKIIIFILLLIKYQFRKFLNVISYNQLKLY